MVGTRVDLLPVSWDIAMVDTLFEMCLPTEGVRYFYSRIGYRKAALTA
jgi:hypothetical protein